MRKKMRDTIILGLACISLIFMLFILTNCTIAPGSSGTGTPPVYGHTNRIAVIGDSISAGINSDYFLVGQTNITYGWVDMLNGEGYTGIPAPIPNIHTIWPDTLVIVNNFSGSGLTAAYWNNSLALMPAIAFNPDIVIVFIGANDVLSSCVAKGYMTVTELTNLSNNISGIMDKLTNNLTNARFALIDYYDFLDGRSIELTNTIHHLTNFSFYTNMSDYALYGESMMSNIATNYGSAFINIYPVYWNHCYGYFLGGAGSHISPEFVNFSLVNITNYIDPHPTTAGHSNIFVTVLNVIKDMTN